MPPPSAKIEPKRVDWKRVFRTVPELDRANKRSGAMFVNILFGLVVTTAASKIAEEFVKGWQSGWESVSETKISHLIVAMTVTVLSWISYHQSQQYPPFLIKFVNLPLVQFGLDIAMVVAYYAIVETSEDGIARPSAKPEAWLVLLVFVLYSLWDLVGHRWERDPAYTSILETPRPPSRKLGPRRQVTFYFTGGALLIATGSKALNFLTPIPVVATDAVLVLFLIAYRLTKQLVHTGIKTRQV